MKPSTHASAARHVVLVGLSGSGKSTVGQLLAARLGRPFVDTDALIEAEAGESIPRIFAARGEPAFRALERRAVARATGGPPAVIATGGGAPVDPDNRAALWAGHFVVWLDAPVEELVRRVGAEGAGRPLLAGAPGIVSGGAGARLQELRTARSPVYATAHLHLDTADRPPEAVATLILEQFHGAGHP